MCYSVLTQPSNCLVNSGLDGVYSSTRTFDKNTFTAYAYRGGYGDKVWIAIGIQQWGDIVTNAGLTKHFFNIPFTKECYYCGCIPWKTTNSGYCSVVYTISKAEFEAYYYNASSPVSACYIALGMQQWGYVAQNQGLKEVQLILPFSNTKYIVTLGQHQGSGSQTNSYILINSANYNLKATSFWIQTHVGIGQFQLALGV